MRADEEKNNRLSYADAHAHVPTMQEACQRIENRILTLASAGTPAEAQCLTEFCKIPGAEGVLIPTFGLHPWHSAEYSVQDLLSSLETCRVVGEIGMDSLWCDVPLKHQREVFEEQLLFACQKKKPVVLHTKDQEREIAELIRQYPNQYLVHWYSADHDLERYLDLDCFFSVGPDVIWNPIVQEVARVVRPERILVETDGMEAVKWAFDEGERIASEREDDSFLNLALPESVRASLSQTVQKTAELRGCDPEVLRAQSVKNFSDYLQET